MIIKLSLYIVVENASIMPKSHKISVRLTEGQFKMLENSAAAEGSSISSHIRRILTFKKFIANPSLYDKCGAGSPRPVMFVSDGRDGL